MAWSDSTEVIALLSSAGIVLASGADADAALLSAIAHVERTLGRSYTAVTEGRAYDGTGARVLPIDPCTSITAVALLDSSGNVSGAASYAAYPANTPVKTGLKLRSGAAWPLGHQNVRVTATFGEEIPPDVARAACMIAALELAGPGVDRKQGNVIKIEADKFSKTIDPDSFSKTLSGWRDYADRVLSGHKDVLCYFG